MTALRRVLLVAAVVPVFACVQGTTNVTGPSACTANIVPALALEVRDSVTQKAIASGVFVTGLVSGKQGTYVLGQPLDSDSLTIWIGSVSGTYNVQLQKGGYQTAVKTGIVVPPADSLNCHPQTVTLDVNLQPTT